MANENMTDNIRRNFESKTTEELLEIWKTNDREEWSDTAFDIISQIVTSRGEFLPTQERHLATIPEEEIDTLGPQLASRFEGLAAVPLSIGAWIGLGHLLVVHHKILPDNVFGLIILTVLPLLGLIGGLYQLFTGINIAHKFQNRRRSNIQIFGMIIIIAITFGFLVFWAIVFDLSNRSFMGRGNDTASGIIVGGVLSLGFVLCYLFRNSQFLSRSAAALGLLGAGVYVVLLCLAVFEAFGIV